MKYFKSILLASCLIFCSTFVQGQASPEGMRHWKHALTSRPFADAIGQYNLGYTCRLDKVNALSLEGMLLPYNSNWAHYDSYFVGDLPGRGGGIALGYKLFPDMGKERQTSVYFSGKIDLRQGTRENIRVLEPVDYSDPSFVPENVFVDLRRQNVTGELGFGLAIPLGHFQMDIFTGYQYGFSSLSRLNPSTSGEIPTWLEGRIWDTAGGFRMTVSLGYNWGGL